MGEVIEVDFGQKRVKAAAYRRDIERTRSLKYAEKFRSFLMLCEDAREGEFNAVLVADAKVLGDTYEELLANISRASLAGLAIVIAHEN